MKFMCSVTVAQPREKVIDLFMNPDNLKHYQTGFIKKEQLSGAPQQNGATAKLYYKMGKGVMELTETVIENNLPNSFHAQYHHKNTDNTMKSSFKVINDNTTLLESEIDYTAFRGFLIKVMAFLFPGMFKKQVQKWLNNLKAYAENQD